ncbi:hypothetical protein O9X98_10670 [Agrobacterium salinitolerans]|nr:hypothetical protein [Agrobacterium salinitolerans]
MSFLKSILRLSSDDEPCFEIKAISASKELITHFQTAGLKNHRDHLLSLRLILDGDRSSPAMYFHIYLDELLADNPIDLKTLPPEVLAFLRMSESAELDGYLRCPKRKCSCALNEDRDLPHSVYRQAAYRLRGSLRSENTR